MRVPAVMAFLFAFVAQPALAQTSPSLNSLRSHLYSLAAASPGNVGIAAVDLASGETVSIYGDEAFPMASTVKIAVAANYLAQVEHGRRSLDDRIRGRTARSLMEAMMIRSDNWATDVLMRDLGGPRTLQTWLNQQGVTGLRIDRNIAQLLGDRRDLRDVRDSSTPMAMVQLLRRIDSGKMLRPHSRALLLDMMARCATGKNRIRGMLPSGTLVQHKTGTLNNYASDVGFIGLPDGRRVAVAMFVRNVDNRPGIIARASRAIYDGFRSIWPRNYALGASAN